nr:retrovirus-related Pol polyprotein from transposon TNT 1-94 [Tanacetum cinerariifolium]
MKPKNVKEAMTDPAWIESMQEELFQFKRLDVWVLVPAPDNISPLTLKWLFKNNHDEEQTAIRNKSRLVVRVYRHEEGIDFEESFASDYGFELTGFSDADYAGCKDTFKSTFGGAQFLGEKLVSWSSKKQDYTALSTAKVEYVSLSACCAQVLWMRTQLTDYGFHFNKIPIYCDSKSDIAISCNSVQHSITKHIAVRYHFIKEHVEKGTIELYFVKTDYQLADLFTKALLADRFNYLVHHLGMRSLSPQEFDRLAKSQGRLLASFQDLEHEGGDTRSQGGIRFKDKDLEISVARDQDPRSQVCKWIYKRIPKNTRLQVSRHLKKDSQMNDYPLGGDC